MSGRPRSFRDCTRAGLRFAARRLELGLDPVGEDELLACYDRLDPSPRTSPCWRRCAKRGVRAGVLSNGDPDMLPRWSATPASPACSIRC